MSASRRGAMTGRGTAELRAVEPDATGGASHGPALGQRPGLTRIQVATIDAIVTLIESGKPGDYGAVAAVDSDAGGLSYGLHQASLMSGNLYEMISLYCDEPQAYYAAALAPYLSAMAQRRREELDHNAALHALLREAARDPVMQRVQNGFFEDKFMSPALQEAYRHGQQRPLACAIIYDSFIHGSWKSGANVYAKTAAQAGDLSAQNTERWMRAYVETRRHWLATHSNTLLRNTVYRMDTFRGLLDEGNWELTLPCNVILGGGYLFHLTDFDLSDDLFDDPVYRVPPERFGVASKRQALLAEGRDKHVQELLAVLGYMSAANVDGKYGPGTANIVRTYQADKTLPVTGAVDSRTYAALRDDAMQRGHHSGTMADEFVPLPQPSGPSSRAATLGGVAASGGAVASATQIENDGTSAETGDMPNPGQMAAAELAAEETSGAGEAAGEAGGADAPGEAAESGENPEAEESTAPPPEPEPQVAEADSVDPVEAIGSEIETLEREVDGAFSMVSNAITGLLGGHPETDGQAEMVETDDRSLAEKVKDTAEDYAWEAATTGFAVTAALLFATARRRSI